MVFRYFTTIMAAAFALAAVLQYNDADALRWVLIYGAASALSAVAAVRGHAPPAAAVAVAAVSASWAVVLMLGLPRFNVYAHLLDTWRMQSPAVEEARESLGLLLVAATATWIGAASLRRARR